MASLYYRSSVYIQYYCSYKSHNYNSQSQLLTLTVLTQGYISLTQGWLIGMHVRSQATTDTLTWYIKLKSAPADISWYQLKNAHSIMTPVLLLE